jgi:hypothetical protein
MNRTEISPLMASSRAVFEERGLTDLCSYTKQMLDSLIMGAL